MNVVVVNRYPACERERIKRRMIGEWRRKEEQ